METYSVTKLLDVLVTFGGAGKNRTFYQVVMSRLL